MILFFFCQNSSVTKMKTQCLTLENYKLYPAGTQYCDSTFCESSVGDLQLN